MSKKDEAFGLFGQGKIPDSPEVGALGLTKVSVKKYYQLWKQLNPESVAEEAPTPEPAREAPAEVLPTVDSITKGAAFEFQGLLFKMEGVEGRLVVGSYFDNPRRRLLFAPDTPVTPK